MEMVNNIDINQKKIYLGVKRVFDFVCASIALVALLWLFALIAILIKIEDGGKVFYNHKRVGQYGNQLEIYKFRSMVENSQDLNSLLTKEQIETLKTEFKIDNDPRITKMGKFLRKTSLDELPQLINIIRGELSIVGPRPILEDEMALHYSDEQQSLFKQIKPGLTGYWQAYARNNATYESGERQRMEMYYIENASILLDLKILLKTVETVIRKTGAM